MSEKIRNMLAVIGMLTIGFGLFRGCRSYHPEDNTDSPTHYSQMNLHTDHLTGCQYLGQTWGGLTPRLDGHGHHVGCHNE